jgi:hypothetical protein
MIIVIPLCSIFIIVGSWILAKGIRMCLKAHHSKGWEVVSCTIERSGIGEEKDSEGDPMFEAKIGYRYVYAGEQYSGDKIFFGYSASSEEEDSSQLIAVFPEGREVEAYINPKNPKEAVLIPGIKRMALIRVWGGFGFAFMGFWFLVMWYLFTGGQADIIGKSISMG